MRRVAKLFAFLLASLTSAQVPRTGTSTKPGDACSNTQITGAQGSPITAPCIRGGPFATADRTLNSKLGDFVSVKDFGAVGNNRVNDRQAIQNAINAANTGRFGLFFPAGFYNIGTGPGLSLPTGSALEFRGDGSGVTRILYGSNGIGAGPAIQLGSPTCPTPDRASCGNFSMSSMAVDVSGAGPGASAIVEYAVGGGIIRDVVIYGYSGFDGVNCNLGTPTSTSHLCQNSGVGIDVHSGNSPGYAIYQIYQDVVINGDFDIGWRCAGDYNSANICNAFSLKDVFLLRANLRTGRRMGAGSPLSPASGMNASVGIFYGGGWIPLTSCTGNGTTTTCTASTAHGMTEGIVVGVFGTSQKALTGSWTVLDRGLNATKFQFKSSFKGTASGGTVLNPNILAAGDATHFGGDMNGYDIGIVFAGQQFVSGNMRQERNGLAIASLGFSGSTNYVRLINFNFTEGGLYDQPIPYPGSRQPIAHDTYVLQGGNIYRQAVSNCKTGNSTAPIGTGVQIVDGTCRWDFVAATANPLSIVASSVNRPSDLFYGMGAGPGQMSVLLINRGSSTAPMSVQLLAGNFASDQRREYAFVRSDTGEVVGRFYADATAVKNLPQLHIDDGTNEKLRFNPGPTGTVQLTTALQMQSVTFSTLPASPVNGMVLYCSDCTIANPCAGSGKGALAKRIANTWICN